MNSEEKKQVVGADGLRSFACLWVFGHHIANELDLAPDWLGGFFGTHGAQGVGVFFVLSGFLLSLPFWNSLVSDREFPDMRNYAVKRLARIVPGYFVCLLVMFTCFHSVQAEDLFRLGSALTFTNSFHWKTFFPVRVNAACWSIGVEMIFYLLLPLWAAGLFAMRRHLQRCDCKKPQMWWWRAYCLVAMGLIVAFQLVVIRFIQMPTGGLAVDVADELQRGALDWLPARNPIGLFAHFLVGCLAASFLVQRTGNDLPQSEAVTGSARWNRFDWLSVGCIVAIFVELNSLTWLIGTEGAFATMMGNVWAHRSVWFISYEWPLGPMLVAGLLISLCRSRHIGVWFDNALMRQTATLSFGIYLWHMPIIAVMRQLCEIDLPTSTTTIVLFSAFTLSLSVAAAWLSYYWIEAPVMRWSRCLLGPSIRPATRPDAPLARTA